MSAPRSVGVNTHGHCFDGAASAALFTALYRAIDDGPARFGYRSCGYGPKMGSVPKEWLKSDVNAILDFRYTESDRLTYYFDHHATGFQSSAEEAEAKSRVEDSKGKRNLVFDPTYGSCTKLISDSARERFGVAVGLDELVTWADRIDAARFSSAEEALGDASAQRIAQVIEHHGDTAYLEELVPLLLERSLDDVAGSDLVRERFAPLAAAKVEFARRTKENAEVKGDVVVVDLSNEVVTAAGKFVTYALFPRSVYSVAILRTKNLIKVSVGYNPWSGSPRRHDIASLCKREGGGGHPVVGAAAFPLEARDQAMEAAARIVRALES